MKIVYYFEPWVELGRPFLRYHNLRYQIGPQIRNMREKFGEIDISVVIGEGTFLKCQLDGFTIPGVEFKVIKEHQLRAIFPDYFTASMHINNNILDDSEKNAFFSLLESVIGNAPDIIVSFLSPLYLLNNYWKDTLVLYAEFGIFSRIPFPRTFYLDPYGMFQNGFIKKHAQQLNNLIPSTEQKHYLSVFRKNVLIDGIKENTPIKKERTCLSGFKRNVLLPLQFSKYFGFDGSCDFLSQYDFLIYVLENISPDIGVVVTEHSTWEPVITEHNETYLCEKYPNLIIPRQYHKFSNASQFLLAEVDAVVSVSSSVGLQALLWDKPIFVLGDSHLSTFNSGNIKDAHEIIDNYQPGQYDGALCFLLERFYPPERYFYSPTWALNFYKKALDKFRSGSVDFEFYHEIDDVNQYYNSLSSDIRVDLFRKQTIEEAKIENHPNFILGNSDSIKEKANLLDSYEYVSFDVFDTLIQRPLMMPHQIFLLMQDGVRNLLGNPNFEFHKLRRHAEHICRKDSSFDEVTIDEIYTVFQDLSGVDSQKTQLILEMEKSFEFKYCEPRLAGRDFFDICKKLGKKIIVISDFYFGKDFVEKILFKSGFNGWEQIFVSSDYRASKKSGLLYSQVLTELSVPGHKIIHLGDNRESDIANSKKVLINSIHIVKGTDLFFNNKSIRSIWQKELKRSVFPTVSLQKTIGVCLGLFINHLYSRPEGKDRNSAFSGNPLDMGYCIFGPIFLGFMLDIVERSRSLGLDDLMFLSRDGNIMYRCYQKLAKYISDLPSAQYLLTSRRVLSVACLENEDDVYAALQIPFKPSGIKHIIENKFGLDISIITPEMLEEAEISSLDQELHPANDLLKIQKMVTILMPDILENAREERLAADVYFKTFIKPNRKSALIDVGYTGSLQGYLQKITGVSSSCLFLLTHLKAKDLAKKGIYINGYLGNFIDHTDSLNLFNSNISLIETVCSSSEPSLKKFILDQNGTVLPIYQNQTTSTGSRIEVVSKLQEGILKFVDDFMSRFNESINEFDFGPDFVGRWFFHYVKNPSKNDASLFNNVEHEDLYSGFEKRYIVANIVGSLKKHKNKFTVEQARNLINISDWKNGARAILPPKQGVVRDVPDSYLAYNYEVCKIQPESMLDGLNNKFKMIINDVNHIENKNYQKAKKQSKIRRLFNKFQKNRRLFFYDSKFPPFKLIYRLFYIK